MGGWHSAQPSVAVQPTRASRTPMAKAMASIVSGQADTLRLAESCGNWALWASSLLLAVASVLVPQTLALPITTGFSGCWRVSNGGGRVVQGTVIFHLGLLGTTWTRTISMRLWHWMGFIPVSPSRNPLNHLPKLLKAQGGPCWLNALQLYVTWEQGLGLSRKLQPS